MTRVENFFRWWSLLAICAFVLSFFAIPEESIQRSLFYNLVVAPWVISLFLVSYKTVLKNTLVQMLLATLLYLSLSALWSPASDGEHVSRTFRELGYIVCLILLACIALLQSPKLFDLLLPPLFLVAIIFSLVTVLHYGNHQGWTFSDPLLPEWKFHNQNRLAKAYGVMLFLGIGSLWVFKNPGYKILAIVNLLASLLVILLSRSKGAAYAVILTLPFLAFMDANMRSLLKRNWMTIAVIGVLIVGLVVSLGVVNDFAADGWSKRNFIWPEVIREWLHSPVFGVGYLREPFITGINGEVFYHEHNMPLALLRQSGVAGLVLFLGTLLWLIVQNFRSADVYTKLWGIVLVYALFASLSGGKFPVVRPEDSWFWIWIPIAFALAAHVHTQVKLKAKADL